MTPRRTQDRRAAEVVMRTEKMTFSAIIEELKSRGIFHLTFFYTVGSWLALQVADVLFPGLGIPISAIRYVLIAEILAFPFVVIFGWLFDVSGGVITRDRSRIFSLDSSRGHALVAADRAVLSVLALAVSAILVGTGINLVAARAQPHRENRACSAGARERPSKRGRWGTGGH